MWSLRKKPGKIQVAITHKLLTAINRVHERCAGVLNRKTAHITPSRLKWYLLLFCALSGGGHLLLLHYSLTRKAHPAATVVRSEIARTKAQQAPESPPLSEADKRMLSTARHLFDSLAATPEGRAQRDSFLSAHPGFMDTLARAEQLIR